MLLREYYEKDIRSLSHKHYFTVIVEVSDDSRSVLKMDAYKLRIRITVEQFLQLKNMNINIAVIR